jgi:peptide/nickel transport system ATP-binding protein
MSGGQLQRVGIARALATQPEFVFLDEPTSALDLSVRGQIINLLFDLQEEYHLAYLFVSHDLRVVEYIADYILVMYLGQIVEQCPKDELFVRPLHPYAKGLMDAISLRPGEVQDRYTLRGDVSQYGAIPGELGCRLTPRCPFAQQRCASEPQELLEVMPGHWVRCWRAAELDGADPGPTD